VIVGANLTATNYHDFTDFEEILAERYRTGYALAVRNHHKPDLQAQSKSLGRAGC
jgi:hypothetical protein